MEIYDDPNRVTVMRPPASIPYDRQYKKNAPGKLLFLLGGVLYVILGVVGLIAVLSALRHYTIESAVLHLLGSCALFTAGGISIKYRCYPNRGMLCVMAAFIACAVCLPWLFVPAMKSAWLIAASSVLLFVFAHILNHF
jgi:magnesium-transporting ATPase (P-type)